MFTMWGGESQGEQRVYGFGLAFFISGKVGNGFILNNLKVKIWG